MLAIFAIVLMGSGVACMSVTNIGILLTSEYHDHRRERGGSFGISKLQSATNESDLSFTIDIIVKIFCVRSCWNEHYHKSILLLLSSKDF